MICQNCQTPLKKNNTKFCGSSCAAQFNNKQRAPRTEESKALTRTKVLETIKAKGLITSDQENYLEMVALRRQERRRLAREAKGIVTKKRSKSAQAKDSIVGEFTRLTRSTCAKCSAAILGKTHRKYCSVHSDNYTRGLRSRYNFNFKVSDYPDLFDLDIVAEYGWYSPGGRSTLPKNLDGVSRDHKVSVHSAIQNGYDPFYITHPLNCQLMLHRDNNSKNIEDSLSYDELTALVDQYEKKRITK